MLLLLRFSDLTQRPKPRTGFWLSDTRQYGFKCEVFIMKCVVAVYAFIVRSAASSCKGVVPYSGELSSTKLLICSMNQRHTSCSPTPGAITRALLYNDLVSTRHAR